MAEVQLWYAVLLGMIQGLTEFIPVSSTAHVRIAGAFLNQPDPGAAFSAVIQLGTLLSLLVYFRDDLIQFGSASLRGLFSGQPFADQDARMAWYLLVGTVPVSVAGLLLSDYIEGPFRSLWVIAASLIGLGILLYLCDRFTKHRREISELGLRDALLIGIGQAFALVPGSSRSGTTLTMGLLLGYSRYAAMRFSFLLSIPAIGLSGVYELIKEFEQLGQQGFLALSVSTLVSAVVGYLTVAGLLRFLRTHTTFAFAAYRVAMGLLIIGLLWSGVLEAMEGIPAGAAEEAPAAEALDAAQE